MLGARGPGDDPGFDPPPPNVRFPVVMTPGSDSADAAWAGYPPLGRGVAREPLSDGSDGTEGSDEATGEPMAPGDPADAGVEPTRERIFDFSAASPDSSATTWVMRAASGTLRAVDKKAK